MLHRELLTAKRDRARVTNRMKELLANQGVEMEVGAGLLAELALVELWDGTALPPGLRARREGSTSDALRNRRDQVAAYCLFDNLDVIDSEKLEEYKVRVAPVVARFDGRYVVMGGRVEVVEGTWKPTFPVMIEFPTLDKAFQWYNSTEYQDLKALRHQAVKCNAVFLESV